MTNSGTSAPLLTRSVFAPADGPILSSVSPLNLSIIRKDLSRYSPEVQVQKLMIYLKESQRQVRNLNYEYAMLYHDNEELAAPHGAATASPRGRGGESPGGGLTEPLPRPPSSERHRHRRRRTSSPHSRSSSPAARGAPPTLARPWVTVDSRKRVQIQRLQVSGDANDHFCAVRAQYRSSVEAKYIAAVLTDVGSWGAWDFAVSAVGRAGDAAPAHDGAYRIVYGRKGARIPARAYNFTLSEFHRPAQRTLVVTMSPVGLAAAARRSASMSNLSVSSSSITSSTTSFAVAPLWERERASEQAAAGSDDDGTVQGQIWHGQWRLVDPPPATAAQKAPTKHLLDAETSARTAGCFIDFELQFDPAGQDISQNSRVLDLIAMQFGTNLLKIEKTAMQRKLRARLEARGTRWRESELPLSSSQLTLLNNALNRDVGAGDTDRGVGPVDAATPLQSTAAAAAPVTSATLAPTPPVVKLRRKSISDARTRFEYRRTVEQKDDNSSSFSKEV